MIQDPLVPNPSKNEVGALFDEFLGYQKPRTDSIESNFESSSEESSPSSSPGTSPAHDVSNLQPLYFDYGYSKNTTASAFQPTISKRKIVESQMPTPQRKKKQKLKKEAPVPVKEKAVPEDVASSKDEWETCKKARRRKQNRVAAQTSREKKKRYLTNLERRVAELEDINRQLVAELKEVRRAQNGGQTFTHRHEAQLKHSNYPLASNSTLNLHPSKSATTATATATAPTASSRRASIGSNTNIFKILTNDTILVSNGTIKSQFASAMPRLEDCNRTVRVANIDVNIANANTRNHPTPSPINRRGSVSMPVMSPVHALPPMSMPELSNLVAVKKGEHAQTFMPDNSVICPDLATVQLKSPEFTFQKPNQPEMTFEPIDIPSFSLEQSYNCENMLLQL